MRTIKFSGGWSFAPATQDDVDAMIEMEKKVFEEEIAFTEPQLRAWIEYNPNMFYVVKKGEQVEAFTAIAPITKECYESLKTATKKDMSEFKAEDFSPTRDFKYCYFADIVARTATKKGTSEYDPSASNICFLGVVPIILENSTYVATTPVTEDGRQAAQIFGFSKDGQFPVKPEFKPDQLHQNYFVQIVPEITKRAKLALGFMRARLKGNDIEEEPIGVKLKLQK